MTANPDFADTLPGAHFVLDLQYMDRLQRDVDAAHIVKAPSRDVWLRTASSRAKAAAAVPFMESTRDQG